MAGHQGGLRIPGGTITTTITAESGTGSSLGLVLEVDDVTYRPEPKYSTTHPQGSPDEHDQLMSMPVMITVKGGRADAGFMVLYRELERARRARQEPPKYRVHFQAPSVNGHEGIDEVYVRCALQPGDFMLPDAAKVAEQTIVLKGYIAA